MKRRIWEVYLIQCFVTPSSWVMQSNKKGQHEQNQSTGLDSILVNAKTRVITPYPTPAARFVFSAAVTHDDN